MKSYVTVAYVAKRVLFPQKKSLKFTKSQQAFLCASGVKVVARYQEQFGEKPRRVQQQEKVIIHARGKRLTHAFNKLVCRYPRSFESTIEQVLHEEYKKRQAVSE